MPTTPQNPAGRRIESPVSVPNAKVASPLATREAEPPEDPPAIRLVSHGLYTGPVNAVILVEPIDSSSIEAFPIRQAFSCFKSCTTCAS